MSIMQAIEQIEDEMKHTVDFFEDSKKAFGHLPLAFYVARDDKVAELLEERDMLHEAYKKISK